MRLKEKIERAATIRELRISKRFPYWFSDLDICAAFELESISRPARMNRDLTLRAVGQCPSCRQVGLLGCGWCWSDSRLATPNEEDRVAILRTSQLNGIIPRWLPDLSLARIYRIDRRRISRLFWTGILCKNCCSCNKSLCLACFLRTNRP